MCTTPFSWGEGLNLQPNFQKKGGLTGPQLLEGGCWEGGGDFFQGDWNFHTKKIKCEIFNDKKVYRPKNIFLCQN